MIGRRFSFPLCTSGLLALSLLLIGCGQKQAVNGVRFHGTATYQGKPIPFGLVHFEPAAGNSSAAPVDIKIKDGKFDTQSSQGKIARGRCTVRISGGDGVTPDPEKPFGQPLFQTYTTSIDISADTATLSFDVPATASSR